MALQVPLPLRWLTSLQGQRSEPGHWGVTWPVMCHPFLYPKGPCGRAPKRTSRGKSAATLRVQGVGSYSRANWNGLQVALSGSRFS